MYQKHSETKRADSAARKKENPEYYALAEWFRKRGIPISAVPTSDVRALIEMKQAVKAAKTISNQQTKT
jgi:hypothetical protein